MAELLASPIADDVNAEIRSLFLALVSHGGYLLAEATGESDTRLLGW